MSRYQAYAEYKDSCVDWLGSIPSNWEYVRLKYVADLIGEKAEPKLDQTYVGMENVESNNGKYIPKEDITPEGLSNSFSNGDVLFGKLRPYLAKSWLADFSGICSSEFLVLRSKKVSPRFLNYYTLTEGFIKQVDSSTYGSKMPRASWEFIGLLDVPVPAYESEKIANFLDHETAKIDVLIEKQQALIELLKEKRQAVISHAVTKGLNPNTPMKDSGVEWLGEVPEHWDVCLLKFKCNEITDGAHISPDTENGEHLFVSITDIKKGVINFENALLTSKTSYEYLIKTGCMPFAGDILFSKDGTIGQTAITPDDIEFVVASSLIIIRPDRTKVTSGFLDFLLQSSLVAEQVESFVKGAALRRLSIQNLLKIFGVFPPIDEQVQISDYLIRVLSRFDELEEKAQELIKHQQERRTALISAAVTGKIDVRD